MNNKAGHGGSISCWEGSDVEFVGTVYFNYITGSAVDLNGFSSMTFTGDTYFYRNIGSYGGAIWCDNSNYITLSGTVYFEGNTAYVNGGAIFLGGIFKLIFKPKLNIFISSHAYDSSGALYFRDSQCSSTVECFITIDSTISTINNISLHFENKLSRIHE